MARTPKQKREITQACRDYPDTGSEKIVWELLRKDESARAWLDNHKRSCSWWDLIARHHIYGRGTGQKNWICNLIGLHTAVHEYCHQVCKKRVEVCCLWAQFTLQQDHYARCQLNRRESTMSGEEMFWNVPAMNAICGRFSLEGRIEVDLMPIVAGTPLEEYCEDILFEAARGDLPF